MSITERIALAAEKVGGQVALAEMVALSRGSIANYISGKTSPQIEVVERIADAAGLPRKWMLTGGDDPSTDAGGDAPSIWPAGLPTELADMVMVPVIDAQPSAGPGTNVDAEPVAGVIALRRDLVRGLGVSSPGALRVLEARGNSMEPTIRAGDLILVDTAIEHVEDEGVYVFRFGGALVVKRIRFSLGSGVELVSDNGGTAERIPEPDLPDLHAAGRVVRVIRAV